MVRNKRALYAFFDLKVILTLQFLMISSWGHAAVWENSFSIPMTMQYESNPSLSSTNEQAISKFIISPAYNLITTQDLNQWTATASSRIERSSNTQISDNREDPKLNIGWSRTLENGKLGLSGHYDESSTRETEFNDSGQVFSDGNRKLRSFAAYWQHELSEKSSLAFNSGYSRTEYTGISLINYTTQSLSSKLDYKISDTLEPFVKLSTSKTKPENNQLETKTNSIDLGILWKTTEYLGFTVTAGVNQVTNLSEKTSGQGSLTLNYLTETTHSTFAVTRSFAPSGITGGVIESNQLHANLQSELSESSRFGIDANIRENLDVSKNKSMLLSANYFKNLNGSWVLQLSAQHRQQESNGISTNNNIIGITFIYNTKSQN